MEGDRIEDHESQRQTRSSVLEQKEDHLLSFQTLQTQTDPPSASSFHSSQQTIDVRRFLDSDRGLGSVHDRSECCCCEERKKGNEADRDERGNVDQKRRIGLNGQRFANRDSDGHGV